LGPDFVFRAACAQCGMVGNLLRRTAPGRRIRRDRHSLVCDIVHGHRVSLADAARCTSAHSLSLLGHLRELFELRHLVAKPRRIVILGQHLGRRTMLSWYMSLVPVIGFAAGTLCTLAYLPQALHSFRTKSVRDI